MKFKTLAKFSEFHLFLHVFKKNVFSVMFNAYIDCFFIWECDYK